MSQNNNNNNNNNNNSKSKEVVDKNPMPEKIKRPHFPAGIRVLIVDDDETCLKVLNAMLLSCQYQVTQTTKATEALELLRKNKDKYDIVITDVIMPDMDGFELLRIIGLEMDVPVIMMSAYDETSIVMKGVRNGARDYLVKPVRITELRNIWQHVMRKVIFDPHKSSSFMIRRERGDMDKLPLTKRRDRSIEIEEPQDNAPPDNDAYAASKKPRFVWTPELHTKFVDVVQQLDADKAVPKKIREVMNVPLLTREIIASHLQKYRNLLRKKQDNTSIEGTSNAGFNIANNILNSNSPTASDNADLNSPSTLRQANSHEGVLSLRDQLLSERPDVLLNEGGLMLVPLNQQNLMHQQNMNSSSLMPDHVLVSNNIPLLENVAQGSTTWAPNPSRTMLDNYIDMASQVPNFGVGQLGAQLGFGNFGALQSLSTGFPALVARQPRPSIMPMAGRVPRPPGPGAAFDGVRAPNHIHGNASNQFSHILQPNYMHGQHEGRGLNVMNGRIGSNIRMGSTSYQAAERTPINTHGTFTQLLTNPNDIEDDYVQAALQEFIKTSAPTL